MLGLSGRLGGPSIRAHCGQFQSLSQNVTLLLSTASFPGTSAATICINISSSGEVKFFLVSLFFHPLCGPLLLLAPVSFLLLLTMPKGPEHRALHRKQLSWVGGSHPGCEPPFMKSTNPHGPSDPPEVRQQQLHNHRGPYWQAPLLPEGVPPLPEHRA